MSINYLVDCCYWYRSIGYRITALHYFAHVSYICSITHYEEVTQVVTESNPVRTYILQSKS